MLLGCQNPALPPKPSSTSSQDTSSELSSNAHVLTADEASKITYIDANGWIQFSQPVSYPVGDIIASGITDKTPGGLLGKVTYSSDYIIGVVPASLEEALVNASFSSSDSKALDKTTLGGNLFDTTIPINNVVIYDLDGNNATTNDQIVANGSVSMKDGVSLSFKIENHKLTK